MTRAPLSKTSVTRLTEIASPGDDLVAQAVEAACRVAGACHAEVHVVFCDDDEISGVHGEFFDDPTPTDVITFPLEGDGSADAPLEGELLISVETAANAASEQGHDAESESLLYVIHGTLHLCGLDDLTPAGRAEMRQNERRALQELGISLHYFE